MPAASLAGLFPWEKVGLLVEFEELKTPLFPGGPPRGVMLQEYVTLRAVREVSASALADQGRGGAVCEGDVIVHHPRSST